MDWQPIKTAPFNTPIFALCKDRSILQVLRIADAFVSPKVGYQYQMRQFTDWTHVPSLPDLPGRTVLGGSLSPPPVNTEGP